MLVAGGSRDLEWSPVRVATVLKEATAGRLVHRVFHGDCRGADHTIEIAATRLGWPVQSIRAQWDRYGDAAGPKRNGQMLRRATEEARRQPLALPTGVLVIAFPGGAGTASLLEQARRKKPRAAPPSGSSAPSSRPKPAGSPSSPSACTPPMKPITPSRLPIWRSASPPRNRARKPCSARPMPSAG